MIRIDDLTYKYPGHNEKALQSVSTIIKDGEYLALIGPNGCGKTTLIRHLNAMLHPTRGLVEVDGISALSAANWPELRRRVGMIFQNPDNQIVGMSVEEDIAFGPGNLKLPPDEIRRRVDTSLAAVGLSGFENRRPHSLSGGEKQLLAIAGLLAMDPKYIVLDEPTSSLDPSGRQMVHDLLNKLSAEGIGIIHITHNMEDAAQAHRILVMNQGSIIADGSPRQILSQVEWLRDLGLAPPRITELLWRLGRRGFDLDCNALDIETALEELCRLLNRSVSGVNDHA